MAIISINGKMNGGKDLVGSIIQYLTGINSHISYKEWVLSEYSADFNTTWKTKKFANKLKDIVCMLIGCTREQLEDRDFKEKELGEEWWKVFEGSHQFAFEKGMRIEYGYDIGEKLTPRRILQLLGTEAGRDIIHPSIWLNSLFADYKPLYTTGIDPYDGDDKPLHTFEVYPKWIITDVRFINEADISNKHGITIRVNRPIEERFPEEYRSFLRYKNPNWKEDEEYFLTWMSKHSNGNLYDKLIHSSETGLDKYDKFTYTIENDGSIEDLIEKVRKILVKEKILENELCEE